MIYYTSAEANFWRVFAIWYGSVIPRCVPQALLSALLGLMFEELQLAGSRRSLVEHPHIVTMLGMVLGYTLVQRSNLAYQRWWEARSSLATVHSRWSETAMQLVEFERDSKLPDAVHFRARIVHLLSLTYALCMADLRGDWKFTAELDTIRAEDPFGIEPWSVVHAGAEASAAAAAPADGKHAATASRIGWSTAIADGVSSGATPHLGLRARTHTRTDRSNNFSARMRESGLTWWRFASTTTLYLHDPGAFRVLSLSKRFGVIGGVSADERRSLALSHSRDRAYLVRTWILRICLQRQARGGLSVPPPVVTRAYQLLSEGAAAYQQARKVGDTPFPFPYVQLVTLLLHAFNVLAPFIISALVETPRDRATSGDDERAAQAGDWHGYALLVTSSFLVVLGYTALNQVSRELEEPFGHGPNHLPLCQLVEEFNTGLVHLLLADAGALIPDDPFIGPDAPALSEEERQTRRNQFGKRAAAASYGADVLAAVEQGAQLHGEHQVSTLSTPTPVEKSMSQISMVPPVESIAELDEGAASAEQRGGGMPEHAQLRAMLSHGSMHFVNGLDAASHRPRAGSRALAPSSVSDPMNNEIDARLTSRDSATAMPLDPRL